jgi:hypothetical protein
MRRAQRSLADFLPLVDWPHFRRGNLNEEIESDPDVATFGCGDARQAVVWLLRRGPLLPDGRLDAGIPPRPATLRLPGLAPGHYRIALWNTQKGIPVGSLTAPSLGNGMLSTRLPPFSGDIAIAIRPD